MRREYHCLVAGLPELFIDTKKIDFILLNFKNQLREVLHSNDFKLIESLFWKYDNLNVLKLLKKPESEINELGNLSKTDFEEIFYLVKDDALYTYEKEIPSYFGQIIDAYKNETPVFPDKEWENQITQLYYNYLKTIDNQFIRKWFEFEMDLTNILTAANCRKYKIGIKNELIGNNEITEKLIKSNARDFGISYEFPKLESILRATEEENIIDREKRIDLIKWELLDEWTFFYYFTIERIFAYTIKVEIIERWLKLDKETGNKLFSELLNSLETSYEFPKDFILK
jgi:hypothetical protein